MAALAVACDIETYDAVVVGDERVHVGVTVLLS